MFDFDAATALGFGRLATALAARATPSLRSVATLTTSLRKTLSHRGNFAARR
jgi:hypothetical protein